MITQEGRELIGRRIRAARRSRRLSQESVALILNVHHTAISQYERGRSLIGTDKLIQIALLLNVRIDYLLGFQKDPEEVPKWNGGIKKHIEY